MAASVYAAMEIRISGRKKRQKEEGCMGLMDMITFQKKLGEMEMRSSLLNHRLIYMKTTRADSGEIFRTSNTRLIQLTSNTPIFIL